MADFDLFRMLRINGEQPTMRDRWTAFYRLWRLADNSHKMWFGHVDCFRILIGGVAPHWIKLMNDCGDDLEINRILPREMRWQKAKNSAEDRKNRLAARLLQAIYAPVVGDQEEREDKVTP